MSKKDKRLYDLTEWYGDREELWKYIEQLESYLTKDQKIDLYRREIISIGKLSELLNEPYQDVFDKYFRRFRE